MTSPRTQVYLGFLLLYGYGEAIFGPVKLPRFSRKNTCEGSPQLDLKAPFESGVTQMVPVLLRAYVTVRLEPVPEPGIAVGLEVGALLALGVIRRNSGLSGRSV